MSDAARAKCNEYPPPKIFITEALFSQFEREAWESYNKRDRFDGPTYIPGCNENWGYLHDRIDWVKQAQTRIDTCESLLKAGCSMTLRDETNKEVGRMRIALDEYHNDLTKVFHKWLNYKLETTLTKLVEQRNHK